MLLLRAISVAALFAYPLALSAATDFRILFDTDNRAATGCAVNGMPGVERVLTTTLETSGTPRVTSQSGQVCSGGALSGAQVIDGAGWPATFNATTGEFSIETSGAASFFGTEIPRGMRIGFVLTSGSSTATMLESLDGTPILFPVFPGRRRAVGIAERTLTVDGSDADWAGIEPLVIGGALNSSPSLRFLTVQATISAGRFYFRLLGQSNPDAPTAVNDSYTTAPGTPITIAVPGVLSNDTDPRGRPLTALLQHAPNHGALVLNADGSFNYSPDGGGAQRDHFLYRASNGAQQSNVARVDIGIGTRPNRRPLGVDDVYAVGIGGALTIPAPGILTNDSDPDADPLTALLGTAPARGILTLNVNGSFTYVHDGVSTAADSFTYFATDGIDQSRETTVHITIQPNLAPVATADAYTVAEGGTLNIARPGVLANDTDVDSPASALRAVLVLGPVNGALTLNSTGDFTYIHNGSETTSDSFTYRASDGRSSSNTVVVSITVTPVNDAPAAVNNAYTTAEDTALTAPAPGVLGNDTDPEGTPLVAAVVTGPANGVLVLSANGSFTYTPNANFNGTDSFTYTASDGAVSSAPATVSITVTPVNDAPSFAAGGPVTVLEDSGAYAGTQATAISAGPADEAGQTLTFTSSNNNNALFSAQPAIAANGTLTFTPAANASGVATVTVTLADNGGGTNTSGSQTFTITVTAVNDAPTFVLTASHTAAEDSGAQTAAGFASAISAGPADEAAQTILFNVSNNNNALFSGQPAIAPDGTLTYTAAPNATGTATVTVTATDSAGATSAPPQTFTITITPVNDAPSFTTGGNVTGTEDTSYSAAWATAISAGPADEATQTLTFNVTANSNTALFSTQPAISASGVLSYTPALNQNGASTITVSLQDNGGGADTSAPVTFTITVNAVNDAPSFTLAGDQNVNEDAGAQTVAAFVTSTSGGPTADEAGQTLTYASTNNNNGLFAVQPSISAAGVLTYTSAPNAFGTAIVSVIGTDNGVPPAASSPVTFTITVNGVNDAPVNTVPGAQVINEDMPITFTTISSLDVDAGGANVGLQLGTTGGGLTLSTTAGLAFTTGDGTNDSSMVVRGSLAAINAALNGLVYTPLPEFAGADTVTITVTDLGNSGSGGPFSDTDTVAITINAVNDTPFFTSGGNVAVDEDSAAYSALWATGISAGAPDESAQVLTFAVSNNNNPLFSAQPSLAADGTLTFTPEAHAFGTATVTVTLGDNGVPPASSAPMTFTITVNPINDEPAFTLGANPAFDEDSGAQTVNGFVTAFSAGPNEGAQTLTYTVTPTGGTLVFAQAPAINAAGNLTFTASPNANGTATFDVVLQDNGSNVPPNDNTSATTSFTITVNPVNDEPSFSVPASAPNSNEDAVAQTVNGFATSILTGPSDESGQTVAFTVTVTAADPTLTFNAGPQIDPSGNLTYAAAANAHGTATVSVILTDSGSNVPPNDNVSAAQTFTITVNPVNDEPSFLIAANPPAVNEDAAPQSIGSFATAITAGPNESAQILTFQVTPAGTTGNVTFASGPAIDATGTLTYTLTANTNGTATFNVALSDNGSNVPPNDNISGTQSFTISVNAVNDEPSFVVQPASSADEDFGTETIIGFGSSFSAGPSDESSQTLSLTLTVTSSDPTLTFTTPPALSVAGTLTYTAAPNAHGTATVSVFLTDDGSNVPPNDNVSPTQTFTITINPVNDAPSFTVAGNPATVIEDAGMQTINAFATAISAGPNEAAQTVSFAVTQTGGSLTFLAPPAISATGVLTYQTDLHANGTATFDVAAVDNGSGTPPNVNTSPTQSFTITVTAVNDAPVFLLPGNPPFVALDAGPQTVSGYATGITPGGASDELTQNLTFNITLTGTTGTLTFSAAPQLSSSTGDLTYAATNGTSGTATFNVTLSDDGSGVLPNVNTSAAQSFTIAVEVGPSITATSPVNGVTSVTTSATVQFTFSEPVTATTASFDFRCAGNPVLYALSASPGTTFTLTPNSPLPATSCVVIVIANEIHDVDTFDGPDTLVGGDFTLNFTVNTPPLAGDDSEIALGHVTLTVADAQGVLANDSDPDAGFVLTVQGAGTPVATTQGGSITFAAGGGYTYRSQAGDQNVSDTVTYTVVDNNGATDTATLTINVGPRFIFVDDTGTPGNGTDATPFHTLQAAEAGSVAGETILVKSGTYADNINLKAGQSFIGQGIPANFTFTHAAKLFVLLTPDTSPNLNRNAAGATVTLSTNNVIRGLSIQNNGGAGILGLNFTSLTVGDNVDINTGGGAALDLQNGAVNATFDVVSASLGAATALRLHNLTGTLSAAGGSLFNTSTTLVDLNLGNFDFTYGGGVGGQGAVTIGITNRTGGTVTFSGAISTNGGISASNNSGGTYNFTNGTKTFNSGANSAVNLQTNTGATFNFTGGGLAIDNISAPAFVATGGGTVTVTGAGNTISCFNNTPVNISSTTIGAAGVTFQTVFTFSGAPSGVILSGTGGGAFSVTGTGAAGSGGNIQNTTVAGISLTNTSVVNLSDINVSVSPKGIIGTNFGTLTVKSMQLSSVTGALLLNNGTLNNAASSNAFSQISSNGGVNAISLTNVNGTFHIASGLAFNASGATMLIQGGQVGGTWAFQPDQTNNAPLLSITDHSIGTLNFTDIVSASNGTGMEFVNADGTYNFSSFVNLIGGDAGVDILPGIDAANGSQGTFTFGSNVTIDNPTGTNFTVSGSRAIVTYSGNMEKTGASAGLLVDITNQLSGTITFQTGFLNSTSGTGTGIRLTNADGTVNFNGTTTLNGGNAGIDVAAGTDVTNGSQGTFNFGAAATITNPSGSVIDIQGSRSTFTYSGSFTKTSAGVGINAVGNQGGTITINGASATETKSLTTSTSNGIFLDNNDGCTISFSGNNLVVNTTSGAAFTAINGGTVSVTGTGNTLTSTTGAALNVVNTDIGASNLNFVSISSNGAASGIILNNTGLSGGLIVTGLNSNVLGGDNSGGTIQNTTGDGISLTSTFSPSFKNMNIQNTGDHGIDGTGVTNFTFNNGKINGAGNASSDNSINFDAGVGTTNVTGVVTITNNQITNTEAEGIDIVNYTGNLSDVVITGNTLTDTGDVATPGSAILIIANANSAASAASVTRATLANNTITDFRAGAGFVIQANSDATGTAFMTLGTAGSGTNVINVTGNLMNGGNGGVGNQPDRFITGAVNGTGTGNFNVSNNGTAGNPIRNIDGVVIELSSFGPATVSATVSNNFVQANNAVGSSGIGIGCDADSFATADNGVLTTTISGNTISLTDGPGIYALARGSNCTHNTKILNNTVAAPNTTTAARAGIRVDSGSASGDTSLCLEISGNNTAGSTNSGTGTTSPGINLRKQGTVVGVNDFGIEGLPSSPAASPAVENHVNSLNTSTSGSVGFGVGGTAMLSGTSGFISCVNP